MSQTIRYFASFAENTPIAIQIVSDGTSTPDDNWREIDLTEFEFLRNNIGDLEYLKELCRKEIDVTAGNVRLRFITSVPGQAETYILKAQEARECKKLGYQVDVNNYPMIQAEMIAQGTDIVVTCETIIAMEDGWKMIAAAIEKERLSGKNAVNSSTDSGSIILSRDNAITLLNSIQ